MQSPSIIFYRFPFYTHHLLVVRVVDLTYPPRFDILVFILFLSFPHPYLLKVNKLSPTWILVPPIPPPFCTINILHITLLFSFFFFFSSFLFF